MIELRILGSTLLQRKGRNLDHSILAGPKRLAILTYLILQHSQGFIRRDEIIAMFWSEFGQKNARNALSNILYHIRDSLGKDTIVNRGTEEICLNGDKIWCDAIAFEESLNKYDLRKALDLYRGDLLPGFHVSDGSNEFNSWLDGERGRLRELAAVASWQLAEEARKNNNLNSACRWAQKAAGHSKYSEEIQARLMTFLDDIGYREEALYAFTKFSHRLQSDWELEPSTEIKSLAEEISNRPRIDTADFIRKDQKSDTERSIAILPFETPGSEKSTAFTNGIHGDLLTRLSAVGDVQVISRTSVRKYANTQKTVKEIGDELNADWLLEGDVQENSGKIQLNVRLINARNDIQRWSKNYRRKLSAENLFQIQTKITKEIADALKAELTPEEKKRVEQQPTANLAAYRLYMQGYSWVEQRTEKGIRRALEFFDQAMEQDSTFALAMTGRALALLALYGYGFEVTDEVLAEAEVLIRQALQQDEDLTEARCALGLLHCERQEGPEAVRQLKRAIELRPGYANAHNKLSWVSQLLGDKDQALESAQKAVEIDPFSPESVVNLAFSKLINGKEENALTEVQRVRELQPTWSTGPFYEAVILYHQERYTEANKLLHNLSVTWAGEGPRTLLALTDLKLGNESSVRNHLSYLQDEEDYFSLGLLQAALGEKEKALSAFERIEIWSAWPTLSINHLFGEDLAILKEEPAYRNIFNKMRRNWGVEEIAKET